MRKLLLSVLALSSIVYSCNKSKPSQNTPVQTAGVTTYVGNGIAGLVNGSGTGAELSAPVDMVVDAFGNLYISDYGNNVIRKVAPGGSVSTFAGNGTAGFKNDALASAEFNHPQGLVIDQNGNIYVADSGNNVIREITTGGQVVTYAGTGTAGMVNGAGTVAQFNSPQGLVIDKGRNIYVADYYNNVIRKIAPDASVSTFAGTGTAGLNDGAPGVATFHGPSGIAIDGSNNLYVAEGINGDIRQIIPSGTVSTFTSSLPNPIRVTVDGSSNLYVSCQNTIQKIDNAGKATVYAGTGTPGYLDGSLLQSEFNAPVGLVSNSQGVVIVADSGNNMIRVVTP